MSYMKPKQPKSRVVDEIDRNLKEAFEDIANEPIPGRFADLLEQLKSGTAPGKDGGDDDKPDY